MISHTADCTGCNACVQKCPQNCITLEEDQYGFLYPKIDETNCVSCNLCNNVCHLQNYKPQKSTPTIYAAVHRKDGVVLNSTSGGIFSAIAENILSAGGVVYGCAFDAALKPHHIRISDVAQLDVLCGSKYIQSDIENCYLDALKDLNEKRTVFFVGTPCQVAGIKTFLDKEYDNLFTADLVCHGVPPYAHFRKFIKWYENRHKFKVIDYSFRSKKNSGWSLAGTCTVEKNGKIKTKKVFYYDNYYYHYFLNGDIYRESCYNCKYANMQRTGDLTLGDFWGIEKIKPHINIDKGCSLLLVNSNKGKEMLELLDVDVEETPLDFAVQNNAQLSTPSKKTLARNKILEEYKNCTAEQIQKSYIRRYRRQRMVGRVKYLIPPKLKKLLLLLKS